MASEDARHLVATARATKLLEHYGVDRPENISLADIAWDQGIEISYRPLKGAAAHLIRVGGSGAITVNSAIAEEGSRRFAIAHELGHWSLHEKISQLFLCTAADLSDYQHSAPELEANTFASEFLMPRFLLPEDLWNRETTLWQAQSIADRFGVSLTSAAIRWVHVCREPAFVVFSDGANVAWWRRQEPKAAGLWLESKQVLSPESLAHGISQGQSTTAEVPWDAWFSHLKQRAETVWESSVRLGNYGTVISILWIPALD
jgi:hypothetical protein